MGCTLPALQLGQARLRAHAHTHIHTCACTHTRVNTRVGCNPQIIGTLSRVFITVMTVLPLQREGWLSDNEAMRRAMRRPNTIVDGIILGHKDFLLGCMAALAGVCARVCACMHMPAQRHRHFFLHVQGRMAAVLPGAWTCVREYAVACSGHQHTEQRTSLAPVCALYPAAHMHTCSVPSPHATDLAFTRAHMHMHMHAPHASALQALRWTPWRGCVRTTAPWRRWRSRLASSRASSASGSGPQQVRACACVCARVCA